MSGFSLQALVNSLELKTGLMWSLAWFLIVLLFQKKKSVTKAFCEGFSFFVYWNIISVILYFFCAANLFCL